MKTDWRLVYESQEPFKTPDQECSGIKGKVRTSIDSNEKENLFIFY